MKLEQQCVSLELAKRLKELGVKQESVFWWQVKFSSNRVRLVQNPSTGCDNDEFDWYAAFTVAELGSLLPRYVSTKKSVAQHRAPYWVCQLSAHQEKAETETPPSKKCRDCWFS